MTSTIAAGSTPFSNIQLPPLAYHAMWPILFVLGAALLGVLAEAFLPADVRFYTQVGITGTGLVAAFVSVVALHGTEVLTASGAVAIDGVGLFIQGTILILAFLSLLLMAERSVDVSSPIVAQASVVPGSPRDAALATSQRVQTEIFPLTSFAVAGMLVFTVANDLLLMFIALEVLSLPLYLMAGLARRRRLLSQEAAVKYFLLGAFASAFFLYGLALLYGYSDSTNLSAIRTASTTSGRPDVLLYAGFALLLVGLLFKAGVAPFHSWTPDVYQGSPTPVTAFMAACTKAAAFGAILRMLYVAFEPVKWDIRPILWAVAITSMVVGAILGLTQTDVKRILAYSSIAHAGFILVGVMAFDQYGLASTMFYLLTYGFATVAAFGIITLVRSGDGEATHLSQWSGLARKSPVVATVFTILLMSMAGIPLTAGFMGKFYVFRAGWNSAGALVVIALVASAIAAFFYLRIIVVMFFAEPPVNGPTIAIPSLTTIIALTAATFATIFLGIAPQVVLDWANSAATLIQ